MRIAIDARSLSKPQSGIGNHTYNLIKNLLEIDSKNQYFLYTCREFNETPFKKYSNCKINRFYFPNGTLWSQTILPFQIKAGRIDVFHSTETMAPLICDIPSIVTVHDLISFLFKEGLDKKAKLASYLFPLVFRKTKIIIADSQNTREDLIRLFKIPFSKIIVIPSSYDEKKIYRVNNPAPVLSKYKINLPYILTVGVLSPRKNIPRLIKAFSLIKERMEILLVIAGPKGWSYEEIFDQVKQLNLGKYVVFTGGVPDEDLPALYSGASVFVYPSLYEGFGIPPLEAMACQIPVVTSNTSSLPEIVGDAGIMVDPLDIPGLARAIIKILSDREFSEDCVRKGLKRIKQFSWKNSAEKTLEVYKEAAEQ